MQKSKLINKKNKQRILIFALCWAAYALAYFGRANLSIAIPEMQNTLSLGKVQLGLLGTIFFWVYGVGQLINGNIGDSVKPKNIIIVSLVFAGISNILFGYSAGIFAMFIFWAANGYFQSMLWGPIVRTLAVWFPLKKRAKISIGISTSMVAGYWLAWGLLGRTINTAGWRWAFWMPGITILAFVVIWTVFFKNSPEKGAIAPENKLPNASAADSTDKKFSLFQVLVKEKLWFIIIACMVQGIIKDGLSLWIPTILVETLDLDISTTVGVIIIIPILNFAGMLFAGWLNGRCAHEETRTVILLFVFAAVALAASLIFMKINSILIVVTIGLTSAFMYGANTLLLASLPMKFIKYNRASSIAGFFDFSSYLAAGISSSITGLIVQNFNWTFMFYFWIAVTFAGVVATCLDVKKKCFK